MNIAHRLGLRGNAHHAWGSAGAGSGRDDLEYPRPRQLASRLQVGTHVLATPPTSARVPNPNEPSIGHRSARRARKLSKEERR